MNKIREEAEPYIQHYIQLSQKYSCKEEIYHELITVMKQEIRTLAENGHYKYQIYLKFNDKLTRKVLTYV